ncbi:putative ABC transporter, ATP-binding protein [Desulfonema limicola]|uniref:ABC transporter, ATP-binding protein n=1 Tax=Desulfonema limicola TaxID=45656 RepID=A0A975B8X6_9BACT|nr:ABC-F family ATP-binding cassette domain-containing protein [Desulfonema limicola]QTA80965.1 putative ABC transporter, ATP-binding protein [Desulfonema limicola]
MISVENLSKSFGGQTLFDQAGFRINSGERVGLVGRNGHGKTTLFRMIIGKESPDSGNIILPKQYKMGYVQQHIKFTENTVLKEGMKGLNKEEKDHHWKVEKVLAGLGFSTDDMEKSPDEFSGGFQVRLNLAKVLVSEPDLLLLDEPTNYLDITSIRWIERFLNRWPRELMLITHDRGFMDNVVTHTVAIHRKKMRKIQGNTGKLYAQIAQDEEIYEKTRVNDEKRQKEIELFISRFRAKARLANMVQSRVKTLAKMEKKEKLEGAKNLSFSFRTREFKGKTVMSVEDLSFFYDKANPLIQNLSFNVEPGDRICVVGKNGKGKTTLLKLLAGNLAPKSGRVTYNPNIIKGFYEQTNVQSLVDTRTVEEEILYSDSGVDRQMARNICGAMMFEGDNALKKVEVLSGGEKSRVMLGKLLATPLNLLLLDEPSNHLDMESCDSMLEAVDDFDGAVIMVTHNEMFLHALAQRLIVFQNEGIFVFEGTYADFLEKGGWEDDNNISKTHSSEIEEDASAKLNKKELRRRRSEIVGERAKILKPFERKISQTENKIDANEKEIEKLNLEMMEASQSQDGKKIADISRSIHNCQTAIDKLFDELEILTLQHDEKNAEFEIKLENLESYEEF